MKMSLVALSLLILLTGPSQPSTLLAQETDPRSGQGTVILNFDNRSLRGDVRKVHVMLVRQGSPSLKKSAPIGSLDGRTIVRFDGVPSGDWYVAVRGENRSGLGNCTGTSNIFVENNRTAEAEITLNPATLSISWGEVRIKWKMNAGNPVLRQSEDGWDAEHYYFDDPTVVKRNGVYHMWYASAENLRGGETFWIAYATSRDGITWTKYGSVLGPGAGGEWMEKGAMSPAVIDDEGVFKMWFVGANQPENYHHGIGYASSRDGMTWKVDPEPVIPTGTSIGATWHPAVLKREGLYYLFTGIANSPAANPMDILLFTSTDGASWQNRGKVYSARRERLWQSGGIVPCEVLYDANRFKMFFTGMEGETFSMGYAESREGMNWTETSRYPVMKPADTAPWSTMAVGFPAVIRDEGKLKIWFSAITTNPRRYQIGYAEEAR